MSTNEWKTSKPVIDNSIHTRNKKRKLKEKEEEEVQITLTLKSGGEKVSS